MPKKTCFIAKMSAGWLLSSLMFSISIQLSKSVRSMLDSSQPHPFLQATR